MKRYGSKVVVASLGLFSLVAGLSGCGNSNSSNTNQSSSGKSTSGGVTNVTVWESELNDKLGQKLAQEFNASHPNIHVTMQYITQPDAFLQKLTAAVTTDSEPDIVIGGDPSWGPQLLKTGKLMDLAGKVDDINKQIYPGLLSAEMYKGHQVGLPYGTGDYALYYNKKDFAAAGITQPPQSWDEVIQDAIKLSNPSKKKYGIYVPFGSDEWTVWTFEGMLWANGGQFLNSDNTKATFNSPAGVKALQTWVDLIYKYHAAPTTSFATPGNSDGSPAFASNVVSMLIDGGWDENTFTQAGVDYGVALFPKGTDNYATNAGIGNLWVFKKGDAQQQAALEFVKWFMKPENLAQVQVDSQDLPVMDAVKSTPIFQQFEASHPYYKVFADNMQYVHTRPTLVSYPDISKVLGAEIDKALHGQESPEDALNKAAQEADQILQQNNE